MKTLIDIADPQIQALEAIARAENRSRAAIIRAAIDAYLAQRHRAEETDAFGIWGERKVDGLDYQEKARSEW